MGNQLAGIAPSQILSVESYFSDITEYVYDKSLGSTRFFKVARARHREGPAVVKVFAIHDPSLPLRSHRDTIDDQRRRLTACPNCLPFQRTMLNDKAGLLFRQFVHENLYDRISTRPFLIGIEKRWLAFQLLSGLSQACSAHVVHGDIKTENVMVTSWGWLLLTDFAGFKPAYLPEDNPADFNFFFDTSRRRTCYLAPERFVDGAAMAGEGLGLAGDVGSRDASTPLVDLESGGQRHRGELTPAMDIFSTGCVIAELFMEGTPPFDLSQLLAYRKGDLNLDMALKKIDDDDIRQLVLQMLQREPGDRLTAEKYLQQQRGHAFPEYFYTFLWPYLQTFVGQPELTPDEKILKIQQDMTEILENLGFCDVQAKNEQDSSLVIMVSVVTSCLQSLRHCQAKLAALELIRHLSSHLTADVVLDRLLPYLLHLTSDTVPRIRAEALRSLTQCLSSVWEQPRSDANVFPEYVFPGIAAMAQDEATGVRLAYAENIAVLAETALRFLEMSQLSLQMPDEDLANEDMVEVLTMYGNYDTELQALQEMVQQKVVTLLSDPENVVKQTLLENGITRLCVFFGRQKANDVLLSHMITFLNDKQDWHLRGAFFDSIVGVAVYVGWQSSSILKPLLQQGLGDTEEFVVCKTLQALTCMCQLSLLQKPHLYDFLNDCAPFLCHPNLWIRHGAVGFISTMAKCLNVADIHCNLLPLLQPYLTQATVQIEDSIVLLGVLKPPLPRPIFEYVLKSPDTPVFFDFLQDRQLIRNVRRLGSIQEYITPTDIKLVQLLRKLLSQGMADAEEDQLLSLREYMLKVHRAKGSSDPGNDADLLRPGTVSLADLKKHVRCRKVELGHNSLQEVEDRKGAPKKMIRPEVSINTEWKSLLGPLEPLSQPTGTASKAGQGMQSPQGGIQPLSVKPHALTQRNQAKGSFQTQEQDPNSSPTTHPLGGRQTMSEDAETSELTVGGSSQRRCASCRMELVQLIRQRKEEHSSESTLQALVDGTEWESKPPPPGWRPKGLLVAHLHEHRAAVCRIGVSDDHSCFATCSNDGSVKVWDSQKMEGKSATTRSKFTYKRQGGHIKALTFCQASQCLATASDNGSIHVLCMETAGLASKIQLSKSRLLDLTDDGCALDLHHFHSGMQSVLAYATVSGQLVGWDLRTNGNAWKLQHDLRFGLITGFAVDLRRCWICIGTSSGFMICWDMRFHLPIATHLHPAHARIRRLLPHPDHHSWIIAAVQGNNEVSLWNMETGARQLTLWSSHAPPLSESQSSSHSTHGMYYSPAEGNPFLLTAGSDMRIRYWDFAYPKQSYIVTGAATDNLHAGSVSYHSKIIEGTEVVQEIHSKTRDAIPEDKPRRGPEPPPVGHHDIITDVGTFQTSQAFIRMLKLIGGLRYASQRVHLKETNCQHPHHLWIVFISVVIICR
uniref:non-specific serine/threonine protein kinase n=1 Tax=Eptatretus burgeri TaxID=7764 RepID=A0A8C4N7G5_EPTBU